jgi:hypothetical protein
LARRPSGRFADFSEIGVHTCLCLKLVGRRSAPMREVIAAIREGLPDAEPGAVFQHVLGALRDCSKNYLKTNSCICSD